MKSYLFLALIFISMSILGQEKKIILNKLKSSLEYRASHPLKKWSGENKNLNGVIIFNEKEKKFLKLFIAAKIIDFDSKNSNRDSHSHEVLDILNFPQVYFFSDKIDIKNNSLLINGYIDFHGVKIDKNITINFISENNIIKFKGGFDISLNDFNIPLPSLMFYKIDEKVDISFEIEFNNAG